MSFEYKSSYIIVIPTGNKKEKPEVGKWGGDSSPLFYPLPTLPSCDYSDCNYFSIRPEEVLLFLVLLIHISTHNRMEINF